MRNHPTPAEAGFVFALALTFAGGSAGADPPAVPPVPAQTLPATPSSAPSLGQALDAFRPTPHQTIALRDFLGRTDKPVNMGVQPNGISLFELRDAKGLRIGQIAVGQNRNDGSIFVARLAGPATFDMTRQAAPPRVVNTRMRGQVSALLSGSLASASYDALTAKSRDAFLRDRPMLALIGQPGDAPDRIIEMEASFFPDGSGFYRILRAPIGATVAMPTHVAAKFYPALQSDGQRAFRSAVLGIDADFSASLQDMGIRLSCPASACAAQKPTPPMALTGELHITRWPHAVVPSASQALIAAIAPPPPPLPDVLNDQPQSPNPLQPPAPQPMR